VLATKYGEKDVSIIVNNVNNVQTAQQTFERLSRAVSRFLQVTLKYKGFIPSDSSVPEAIREQKALLELYPSSSAARAFVRIAETVDSEFYGNRVKGGMQFFFKQLLEAQHGY
jgi:flagellar biosynthesis protein FlhG